MIEHLMPNVETHQNMSPVCFPCFVIDCPVDANSIFHGVVTSKAAWDVPPLVRDISQYEKLTRLFPSIQR